MVQIFLVFFLAAPADIEAELEKAQLALDSDEFENAAVSAAEIMVDPEATEAQRARAAWIAGVAYVELQRPASAAEAFRFLYRLDPEFRPPGSATGERFVPFEPAPAAAPGEARSPASGGWRPALQLVVGGMVLTRHATITGLRDGRARVALTLDSSGPFPAGYLAYELFPAALTLLGGKGALGEGIGLHFESFFSNAWTPAGGDMTYVRGGPSFRFVWWDSPLAPDTRLDVGISYFQATLRNREHFPSVEYSGHVYLGASFTVPLFTEYASLLAAVHCNLATDPNGEVDRLGQSERWAASFVVQGGLRVAYWIFEGRVLVRYQYFSGGWGGVTEPALGVGEFEDATLLDEIAGVTLAVGIAL